MIEWNEKYFIEDVEVVIKFVSIVGIIIMEVILWFWMVLNIVVVWNLGNMIWEVFIIILVKVDEILLIWYSGEMCR